MAALQHPSSARPAQLSLTGIILVLGTTGVTLLLVCLLPRCRCRRRGSTATVYILHGARRRRQQVQIGCCCCTPGPQVLQAVDDAANLLPRLACSKREAARQEGTR